VISSHGRSRLETRETHQLAQAAQK
jgi:hypothetical protein